MAFEFMFTHAELALFEPVRPHLNRHDCMLLPFESLVGAIC